MIVGYLAGRMQKQHAAYTGRRSELENMFVKDDYRSSGVGAKLVDAFFEWSRKQGTRYAMVNAFSPNTRAIAFYEKQSFEPYSTTLWKDLNNVEDESL
jgi:GNAT superfamily N-acetyltransferase